MSTFSCDLSPTYVTLLPKPVIRIQVKMVSVSGDVKSTNETKQK